jgi:drug/metabolite transporter (DMT)-like permease
LTDGRQQRLAYAAWIAVCVFWGTTYLAIRICLETMPPLLMAGLRNIIAGLVLGALLAARGVPLPERSSWPGLVVMGLLLLGLGNGCVVWAEQWVPSGVTAVVVATTPFWMVGLDATLPSGEPLTRRHLMGLVLGFLGILMLVWPDLQSTGAGSRRFLAGFVALQVACISWTLGSAYSRRHARHENVLFAAAAQMAVGGAALLLLGTILGEWPHLRFTMRTSSAFVYLIVLGSLVGFVAYVYALKYLPVATVSLYAYVNPVIAVVLGMLLLDEPFTGRMAVAVFVIFLGILVVRAGQDLPRLRAFIPRILGSNVE